MDRILVINLTRMGDIIQTGPLLQGLRARHPGAELGLLVLRAFAGAARLLPGIDRLLLLDQDQAVGRLLERARPLAAQAAWFRAVVEELRGDGWDLVVNLSHSRDSAALALLLARGETRGITLREDARTVVRHDWARYFFCVTGNRAVNHFNIVDIYRRVGGLGPGEGGRLVLEAGPAATARAADLLGGLPAGAPLVLVQPGASRENRRWPVERLAESMDILRREAGACIAVVGSAAEAALGASLRAALEATDSRSSPRQVLDLSGRTSLEELAALCSRADLLVTNDTGTLHVAAARGLPSVSLFFATALPWETGPWLPGCLVLQAEMDCAPCSHHVVCPHVMCRERIPAAAVAGAALELLRRRGYAASRVPGWDSLPGVRAWETRRDRHGLQDLLPLGGRVPRAADLAARAYRELWTATLGAPEDSHPDPAALTEAFAAWLEDWGEPEALTLRELGELDEDLSRMAGLARAGAELVDRVDRVMAAAAPDPAVLEGIIDEVTRLDDSIFSFELSRPLLRPLGVLFRFGKEELRDGESLAELGRGTRRLYRELESRARLLRAILDALALALGTRARGEAA